MVACCVNGKRTEPCLCLRVSDGYSQRITSRVKPRGGSLFIEELKYVCV